jgi:hypothetical protein
MTTAFDRDYLVEQSEHAGRTVKIFRDPEPESPRGWDNFATLACWHRRRDLGDKRIEGMDLAELREKVTAEGDEILAVLPLFAYEHGGITMSTRAFSDAFDSGQVGWGYVTKSQYEQMGCKPGEVSEEKLRTYIQQEVSCYAEYLTGQVYGYRIVGRAGDELDSCWGIFDLNYCRSEAKLSAEHSDDPADDRDAAELAQRATYAGPSPAPGEVPA